MGTLHGRLAVTSAATLVLLGVLVGQSAEAAAPARNTYGFQCSFESASGLTRIWWREDHPDQILTGDDGGAASDGKCATVPASVPWMADQIEAVMHAQRAAGLPMTKSDKGIQRITSQLLDDGSGAFDVFLDGAEEYALASADCRSVTYYPGRSRAYRTMAKMYVNDVPATVPDGALAQRFRVVFAHELVHVAQCAVTNPKRAISASNLNGAWIEAVPQAMAMGLVGGEWQPNACSAEAHVLSASSDDDRDGYGQWPFWYSLLKAPNASTYVGMLRDVIRAPVSKAGAQLARVVRARFSDAQLSQALLGWSSAVFLGDTLPSASGIPITWTPQDLDRFMVFSVDEATGVETPQYESPIVGRLTPPAGGSAQVPVTLPPMTCAGLLVPWPDGAETLSVGAAGAPGGELANVMTAGLDVAPGTPSSSPCRTDGARTVVPLSGGQFVATRPCVGNRAPEMWVLMANGGRSPLTMTVTATAT
jgi:hypothetical protein